MNRAWLLTIFLWCWLVNTLVQRRHRWEWDVQLKKGSGLSLTPREELRQRRSPRRSPILPVVPLERSSDGSLHPPKATPITWRAGRQDWSCGWPGLQRAPKLEEVVVVNHPLSLAALEEPNSWTCLWQTRPGVLWLKDPWAFPTIWFPRTGQSDGFAVKLIK